MAGLYNQDMVTQDTAGGFFWGRQKGALGGKKGTGPLTPFVPVGKVPSAPPPADQHAQRFHELAKQTAPEQTNYTSVLRTLISALRKLLLEKEPAGTFELPSFPVLKGGFAPAEVQAEHPEYFHAQRAAVKAKRRAAQLSGTEGQYCFDRKAVWRRPAADVAAERTALAAAGASATRRAGVGSNSGSRGHEPQVDKDHPPTSRSPFVQGLRWSKMQAMGLKQKRQRGEHVLSLLTREMESEISRQKALYDAKPEDVARKRWEVARERAEAADWIMRILHGYGLIKQSVMLEYLEGTLDAEEAMLLRELGGIRDGRRVGRDSQGVAKDLAELVTDDMLAESAQDKATKREAKRWAAELKKKPDLRKKEAAQIKRRVKVWVDGRLRGRTEWDAAPPKYDMSSAQHSAILEGTAAGAELALLTQGSLAATAKIPRAGTAAKDAQARRTVAKQHSPKPQLQPRSLAHGKRGGSSHRSGQGVSSLRRKGGSKREKPASRRSVRILQPSMTMTKTDIEEAVQAEYETENVRDTVKLMYELMSQQAKEPPNGRYSHLLGRWWAT